MNEVTIKLVGQLDLDLTKRGLKVGEVHKATLDGTTARFMDKRIDDKYPASIYQGNYEILDDKIADYQQAIQHLSKKLNRVEREKIHSYKTGDKQENIRLSNKRLELQNQIAELQKDLHELLNPTL